MTDLFMEGDCGDIIKDGEEVSLDGVSVRGLPQYLQQGWVRHEEEPGKYQPLLLQISWEQGNIEQRGTLHIAHWVT